MKNKYMSPEFRAVNINTSDIMNGSLEIAVIEDVAECDADSIYNINSEFWGKNS